MKEGVPLEQGRNPKLIEDIHPQRFKYRGGVCREGYVSKLRRYG